MLKLIDWHFTVQQGLFFDKQIKAKDYVIYSSDIITDGFWNYAFLLSDIKLGDILHSIEKEFKSLNRESCVYLINDSHYEERYITLERHGYSALSEESFMLYSDNPPEINTKSNLDVYQVTNEEIKKDFINVFTSAYGGEKTPEQPYGELDKTYIDALSRSFTNTQKYLHYVCYDRKNPVSIATLCFVDGKGGLYSVGTLPTERGKGYGTIVTKACIDKWRELGGTKLFLQTETGSTVEKWYYKLGFELQFIGKTFTKDNN